MEIRSAQPASSKFLHFWATIIAVVSLLPFSTPSYARDVTLTWDHSPAKDLAGYWVYYKKGFRGGSPYDGKEAKEGKSPKKIGKVATYTLTGLSGTGRYFFAVRAYDSSGRKSAYSNEVCINCKAEVKREEVVAKEPEPIELAIVAPVTLPSGAVTKISRGQVEEIKKQPGVFYGAEAADMLGPGEVVVSLPDELGGGYIYGKPEHLAQAFNAVGATEGTAPAEHLFVKRRSCLMF
ncbi:MAG: fibronectin type III domain-containing protein [Syntrophobacteria bacterium]